MPGYGLSNEPSAYTMSAICSELEALPDLPVGTPILGNCSGAIIAAALKERNPERWGSLVMLEPFAFVPWYFGLFLVPGFGPLAFRTAFSNPIGRWFTNRFVGEGDVDMMASFAAIPARVPLGYLRVLREIGTADFFAASPEEPLILFGERTFPEIHQSVEMWTTVWPDATARMLANVGHLPIEEAPGQVAQALNDVLATAAAATRAGCEASTPSSRESAGAE
ncbi:MAG: pimeloyl-ACP methyl ester carboxylesterase [Bradymonadia bacterium]|jgi:pimeloyl-ACP methyl ester carboxylesterase